MQLGMETVPVLVGPVSYLLLSKPAKAVEKSFSLLSLIDKIIPVYKYDAIVLCLMLSFSNGKNYGLINYRFCWIGISRYVVNSAL